MGLQVMHRFLTVFGTFRWNDYVLAVQGPITIAAARAQQQGDDLPLPSVWYCEWRDDVEAYNAPSVQLAGKLLQFHSFVAVQ